jgi:hypothetical protein
MPRFVLLEEMSAMDKLHSKIQTAICNWAFGSQEFNPSDYPDLDMEKYEKFKSLPQDVEPEAIPIELFDVTFFIKLVLSRKRRQAGRARHKSWNDFLYRQIMSWDGEGDGIEW